MAENPPRMDERSRPPISKRLYLSRLHVQRSRPPRKASSSRSHRDHDTKMMWDNQTAIRRFLKSFSKYNTFSLTGIESRQRKHAVALSRQGWSPHIISKALHRSWGTLDKHARSAACLYEQYRLQLCVLTYVLPRLIEAHGPAFHVTLASPKWIRSPSKLKDVSTSPLQRKFRDGVDRLKKNGVQSHYLRDD